MVIELYRHGATPGNLEHRYVGSSDQPLAPEGMEQARSAAAAAPEVQLVYRSPMLRCAMTADIIFPDTEKVIIDGLHETNFGAFENRNYDELMDDPDYRKWLDGGDPPGGEGRAAAADRAAAAFGQLVRDAGERGLQHIAVVCHGGTIMSIMSRFVRPAREFYYFQLPNCGHYTVSCSGCPPVLTLAE